MTLQPEAIQSGRIETLESFVRDFLVFYPDCAQLLDGWHADGTAWSEWDERVRQHLVALGEKAGRLAVEKPRSVGGA